VCAKLAAIGTATKVVFWIPAIPLIFSGAVRRSIYRVLAKNDVLIFISEAVRRAHEYPRHTAPLHVIYYGVEDPLCTPEHTPYSREQRPDLLGLPAQALVCGYVAEFVDWKDHETLLKAFFRVSSSLPNLYLVLVGTGQTLARVRAMAEASSCRDRILFLGARTDARRLLGLFDIYVHPSRGEGLGLAVVEAMLASVPVVTSDEGAFPEYVFDMENGLLFTAGQSEELAARITMLANDRLLRDRLAEAGRKSALNQFSMRQFGENMSIVFERMTD
jgi:glycosyltransferase involved in cell wall biosynthesis